MASNTSARLRTLSKDIPAFMVFLILSALVWALVVWAAYYL